jgi:hypothetical protein
MATPAPQPIEPAARAAPKLSKGNIVSLQSVGITEAELEKFIDADPTVLGLGDVFVIEHQRRQDKAGRLDLLLQDDSEDIRYEVELMLGSVDESHLIRTIEYWDIERRRYPAYDHRAVLIAENITTRFLNVITLFSGSIPIIAIQVNALNVDGKIVVTFVRVVDSTKLRKDDQAIPANPQTTDRAYWLSRVGPELLEIADKCLVSINEVAKRPRSFNYNKYSIGLADGARADNFVYFSPKKAFLRVTVSIDSVDEWVKRLEQAAMDVWKTKDDDLKFRLMPKDYEEKKGLIRELLHAAVKEDESE